MIRLMIRTAIALLACLLPVLPVHAQLFRAYLSSTGNDSNPCTLQLPCRLLPAAHTAVADGGEIWMLDSANYNTGTVTITKSVSILAIPGQVGSLVATGGGAALFLNTAGTNVGLRNLVFTRLGSGTNGILASGPLTISVEGCLFVNLVANAIDVSNSATDVNVRNTIFRNIIAGAAVLALNGPRADVANSHLLNVNFGLTAVTDTPTTTMLSVSDTTISGGGGGVVAQTNGSGSVARAFVTRSTIRVYGGYAFEADVFGGGGTAIVTVSNSTAAGNSGGIYISGAGVVRSLGNNYIDDAIGDFGSLTPVPLR
jgi:hypothetical protein